jgi:hypothetical protein
VQASNTIRVITVEPTSAFDKMTKISQLEEFLTSLGLTWYYTGGYAAQVWGRTGQFEPSEIPPTDDLDIVIVIDDLAPVYRDLFGTPSAPSQVKVLEGYKVSLLSGAMGREWVSIGTAHVLNLDSLIGNYAAEATADTTQRPAGRFGIDLGGFKLKPTGVWKGDEKVQFAAKRDEDESDEKKAKAARRKMRVLFLQRLKEQQNQPRRDQGPDGAGGSSLASTSTTGGT